MTDHMTWGKVTHTLSNTHFEDFVCYCNVWRWWQSHTGVVSSVDLGSNFNFAILVLIMLLLVSQMEVGSTSTTVGSCTEPKLAGSIAQEPSHVSQRFNLTPDMTIMLFYEVAWYTHACNLLTNTDKTRNFSWCFYWLRCVKKSKRETNTRYSSIRHVSSAFGPASGSWTAALEQVKRWLHTVVEVTTLRPLSK